MNRVIRQRYSNNTQTFNYFKGQHIVGELSLCFGGKDCDEIKTQFVFFSEALNNIKTQRKWMYSVKLILLVSQWKERTN